MADEPKHDSAPFRVALAIFCIVTVYFATILAITIALQSVSERTRPREGSRPTDLRTLAPTFVFDYSAQKDFERRLAAQHTVPIVAVLGVVVLVLSTVLTARMLIRRYRSRPIAGPKVPQWMTR